MNEHKGKATEYNNNTTSSITLFLLFISELLTTV